MNDGVVPADLQDKISELLSRSTGPRSRWALQTAIAAAETEGVAGVFIVKIPPRSKDYLDVTFTVGTVDVISRWGEMV